MKEGADKWLGVIKREGSRLKGGEGKGISNRKDATERTRRQFGQE